MMKKRKSQVRIATNVKDKALVQVRRHQIYQAALQAFTKNGFHETNLRQVTKLAGLAYGSIYDYVKTKNDILFLIYDSVLDELHRRLEEAAQSSEDPLEQLQALIRAAMDHTDEYQDAIVLLYQESRVMKSSGHLTEVFEKERGYIGIFTEVLEQGAKLGIFKIPSVKVLENLLPIMCSTWALKRWNLKGVSKAEYVEALTQFILQGVGATPRKRLVYKRSVTRRDGKGARPHHRGA
jgi:AcrR family transcriptional regulator